MRENGTQLLLYADDMALKAELSEKLQKLESEFGSVHERRK